MEHHLVLFFFLVYCDLNQVKQIQTNEVLNTGKKNSWNITCEGGWGNVGSRKS